MSFFASSNIASRFLLSESKFVPEVRGHGQCTPVCPKRYQKLTSDFLVPFQSEVKEAQRFTLHNHELRFKN